MASFDLAIPVLLKIEGNGKISNDPNDPGGLTKWGISQRSYPTLDIANLSRSDAIELYRNKWWRDEYAQLNNQSIATKIFNLSVLMGEHAACLCLQRAIRAASGVILAQDGLIGQKTVTAANMCNPDILLAAFRSESAAYLRSISNPTEQEGWQNRAYA